MIKKDKEHRLLIKKKRLAYLDFLSIFIEFELSYRFNTSLGIKIFM